MKKYIDILIRHKKLAIVIAAVIIAIPIVVTFWNSRFNVVPQLVASSVNTQEKVDFPKVDLNTLAYEQRKVVTILEEEYKAQPPGTKYSEGADEAWCADFVSWVFNKAGVPLANPNNGHWRIPDTFTLREYYESNGKFRAAGSGYVPKVGDIMLYDNPSPFGQHTNIIIQNDNGIVTTVGGNEPGGIRVVKHTNPDKDGFLGYGVF